MKQERTEKGNSHLLAILQIPHNPYMVLNVACLMIPDCL